MNLLQTSASKSVEDEKSKEIVSDFDNCFIDLPDNEECIREYRGFVSKYYIIYKVVCHAEYWIF